MPGTARTGRASASERAYLAWAGGATGSLFPSHNTVSLRDECTQPLPVVMQRNLLPFVFLSNDNKVREVATLAVMKAVRRLLSDVEGVLSLRGVRTELRKVLAVNLRQNEELTAASPAEARVPRATSSPWKSGAAPRGSMSRFEEVVAGP